MILVCSEGGEGSVARRPEVEGGREVIGGSEGRGHTKEWERQQTIGLLRENVRGGSEGGGRVFVRGKEGDCT